MLVETESFKLFLTRLHRPENKQNKVLLFTKFLKTEIFQNFNVLMFNVELYSVRWQFLGGGFQVSKYESSDREKISKTLSVDILFHIETWQDVHQPTEEHQQGSSGIFYLHQASITDKDGPGCNLSPIE